MELMSGEVVYEVVKVHLQVNSGRSSEDIMDTLNKLREFTKRIEWAVSEVDGLEVIQCKRLGPRAINIGKNEFGIPICRSVLELKYNLT